MSGGQDTDSLGITLATKLTDVMNETMNDPMVGILHHDEGVDLVPANFELSAILFYIHSEGGLIINGRDLWICTSDKHRPE